MLCSEVDVVGVRWRSTLAWTCRVSIWFNNNEFRWAQLYSRKHKVNSIDEFDYTISQHSQLFCWQYNEPCHAHPTSVTCALDNSLLRISALSRLRGSWSRNKLKCWTSRLSAKLERRTLSYHNESFHLKWYANNPLLAPSRFFARTLTPVRIAAADSLLIKIRG